MATAPGTLQLGNVIATPTASVTPAQTAAALASGFKPISSSGAGSSPTAPASTGGGATSIPAGHTATGYIVPAYNSATGAGTLSGIARELGISTIDLLNANPSITNPNVLHQGQQLNVPDPTKPKIGYVPAAPNMPATSPAGFGSAATTQGFGSTGTDSVNTAPGATPTTPGVTNTPAATGDQSATDPSTTVPQPTNPAPTTTAPANQAPAGSTATTDPTGNGDPSYIQGSGPQRSIDQQTSDQVAAITSYYGDQTGALSTAHEQAQSTIDDYLTQLQQRNDAEVENINASFDVQGSQLAIKNAQTVGQSSMALARMGGYLGDSASGISYLNSLNTNNQLQVTALNVARAQAVQAANDSIADKNFAAAQAKISEAKGYNDSINALYTDTFNKIQAVQTNNLTRQKQYLDNQTTVSSNMAPALAAQFTGDLGHDRALAEAAALQSGGQVSADSLMAGVRDYQLKVQQVNQAGTHFFPVNDPITGQPVSVTKVNPDGTTTSLSLQGAMQAGYSPIPGSSNATGVSAGTQSSGKGDQVSSNPDGSETVNGNQFYFRTINSNNFHTLPNGKAYVDISSSPNQSIAMIEAKKTGLPIITSAQDASDLTQAQKVLDTIDNMQTDYNQLAAPNNNPLSKVFTGYKNDFSPLLNQDKSSLINSYNNYKGQVLGIIGTEAGGQPRTTGNLIELTEAGLPSLPTTRSAGGVSGAAFGSGSVTDGNVAFNKIRDQVRSVIDAKLGTKTDPNDMYTSAASNVSRLTAEKYPSASTAASVIPVAQAKTMTSTPATPAGFGWNP